MSSQGTNVPAKRILAALTPTEELDLGTRGLAELRARAYQEQLATMGTPPVALQEWAALMQGRFGERVKVWHAWHPWLIALLVVRYGEAVEHWPEAFSDEDQKRAVHWLRGDTPFGVDYDRASLQHLITLALVVMAGILSGLLPWASLVALPIFATNMTDFFEDLFIKHQFRTGNLTMNAWAATTVYAVGDIVRPTTHNNRRFRCVIAGTSAGVEPTWNTTFGAEQSDNSVTWQTIAEGLPKLPLFMALYTAAPGETGGGTEVSAGGYSRVALHPLDANWNAPAGGNGLTDNVATITFGPPSADWGVVTHLAFLTRASSGDMQFYGALAASRDVKNGDTVRFQAGDLDVIAA